MPTINFPLFLLCFLAIFCHVNTISSSSSCVPSSCGKVQRIGFPFRLESDPANCGDPKFELECRNNQLLINLNSNKFNVESIDYRNYTIRVIDPALDKNNPCSFSFLYTRNLEYSDYIYSSEYGRFSSLNVPLAFINCANPLNSSAYVDISSCRNSSGVHSYVVESSMLSLSDLEPSCGVDKVIPVADLGTGDYRSLSRIHEAAASGFELSWYYGMCPYNCYGGCTIEDETLVCHKDDSCDDHTPYGQLTFRCQFQIYWLIYIVFFIAFPLVAIVGLRLLIGIPSIIVLIMYRNKRRHPLSDWEKVQEITKGQTHFKPIYYTYHEIKKMTNNFKQKFAVGSHGSLYRGKLRSGPSVAVKMVENSAAKSEDFLTFVAAIGRADHPNVMQLIGFCFEGRKRGLVYDLMPNGSIQKYISPKEADSEPVSLSCEVYYNISLGIGLGINYLHENLDVHLGFKPHNVLLDENLVPKISDFGMNKLYPKSVNSAPESHYKGMGEVSQKSDVCSFGMMLVGMVSKLKNVQHGSSSSSSSSSTWIHQQLVEGNVEKLEIRDASEEEKKIIKKMMKVASLCIRMKAGDRPSMDEAVKMLEQENGDHEIC